MKMRSQAIFPMAVLTLLAALTFWLERSIQPAQVHGDGKDRHDPDFIVENFIFKRLDPTGHLQHTLQAIKMTHYPDDDSTEVDRPRATMYGRDAPAHATGDKALVSSDGAEVVLIGNVLVRREASAKSEPVTLATSVLTVFPDDEIARTTEPVTLTQGSSVMHGVGLEADNVSGVFSLLSKVTGTVYPQKTSGGKSSPTS